MAKNPGLVHAVGTRLGISFLMRELYQNKENERDWRENFDTIHLLINHRHYLDIYFRTYRYFNERNILHYPFNFGEMARAVMNHNQSIANLSPIINNIKRLLKK